MRFHIRPIALVMALLILIPLGSRCVAGENTFKGICEDSLYGGLAGALVGTALMAFTHNPEDHNDYIVYGAASGVLVGATYGLVNATRSLATVENGRIRLSIPTILTSLDDGNSKGEFALTLKAILIQGTF